MMAENLLDHYIHSEFTKRFGGSCDIEARLLPHEEVVEIRVKEIASVLPDQAGVTAVLKDFRELSIYGDGRSFRKKLFSQDKGQKYMVRAFVEAVRAGQAAPIPFEEIYTVSLTTLRIMESLQKRQGVGLNLKSMTVI